MITPGGRFCRKVGGMEQITMIPRNCSRSSAPAGPQGIQAREDDLGQAEQLTA
jgi:hypothetical protein